MDDPTKIPEESSSKNDTCLSSATHDAHDISTLADLPGRRMKTKLWPMSPIESLTTEEVLAIANRDQTPVLIATVDGDDSGEKYLCANKKGVSLPPEVAAEGSWAQKYYQQVAILNDSLKEMQQSFQPVWELAKSQQALLVSVEVFDGLLAVANQGLQLLFKSWTQKDMKAIITKECDIRVQKQVHYYSILKNYTMGKFESLDQPRLQSVEDLLLAGETYLMHHAQTNGFKCPTDIRALFQEFLPLKRDRNEYSHPLTLAKMPLASTVLQKLRASIINDEFDFIKGTKNLILLGADYAESVLQSYGKVRQKLFLDPKRSRKISESYDFDIDDESPHGSLVHSPRLGSPGNAPQFYTTSPSSEQNFQIGQSSRSLSFSHLPQSPKRCQSSQSTSLGSPLVLTYPHGSETLQRPHALSLQIPESSQPRENNELQQHNRDCQCPLSSPSLECSPSSQDSPSSSSKILEISEPNLLNTLGPPPDKVFKRPRQ